MKKIIAILISVFTFCSCIPALAIEDGIIDVNDKQKQELHEESKGEEKVRKVVFLTFDDGPTKNTLKNLEILKEQGVKGTFFVIGELVEQNPEILKQVQEEGHEICVHTYNHETKNYKSKGAFMDDYHKAVGVITNVLGREPSKFMRMPGGSSTHYADKYTLRAIRDQLFEDGIYYVDWNVSLEDAIYSNTPVDTLLSTFRKELKKTYIDHNNIIVLMHDGASNGTTPQALPTVIKYFKENNYEFKTFADLTEEEFNILLNEKQINKYNRPKQTNSQDKMEANPTMDNSNN